MALKQRLLEEMRRYAILTVYLYVCFAAIIWYRTSLLHAYGIESAFFGIALIKALVVGKFMMLGEMAKVGERLYHHRPRILRVFYKSLVLLAVLLVLSVIEEAVRGMLHGEYLTQAIADFGGGTWGQIAAICLLMWLILLPYLLMLELGDALGTNRLRDIFLSPA